MSSPGAAWFSNTDNDTTDPQILRVLRKMTAFCVKRAVVMVLDCSKLDERSSRS